MVFLPLITITGVTGTFFRALAVTVGVALLTSLAAGAHLDAGAEPLPAAAAKPARRHRDVHEHGDQRLHGPADSAYDAILSVCCWRDPLVAGAGLRVA